MNGNVASLEAIKSGDLEKEFARVGRLYRNICFFFFDEKYRNICLITLEKRYC